MPASVSLCMIVKNEGEQLGDCLRAASAVVSEVILVDTGSTDDTVAVASRLGARLSRFDFHPPDFAAARNHSLDLASEDWILVLDADERLTSSATGLVEGLCGEEGNVGYVVQRRNLRKGMTDVPIDHAVRLFRNRRGVRYRGRVHETVDASILASGGQIRTSHLVIDHLLPPDDGRSLDKSRFYLKILDEELERTPDDVDRLGFRRAELHKQGRLDEASRAAERLAELAPGDASHHVHVGLYRLVHHRDVAGAERAFRRALQLRPDDAQALACLRGLPAAPAG